MPSVPVSSVRVIGDDLPGADGQGGQGSRWCAWLQDILILRGHAATVVDYTRPGTTAHKIMENLTDDVLLDPPGVLIIHAGRSDALGVRHGNNPWAKDAGGIAASLRESIRRVRARRADVKILIMTPVMNALCSSPYRLGPLWELLRTSAKWLEELAIAERCTLVPAQALIRETLVDSHEEGLLGHEDFALNLRGSIMLAETVAGALGATEPHARTGLEGGDVLVAIGDSITDANRRSMAHRPLGHGYLAVAEALLWLREPQHRATWINRGMGGDTMVDVESRWRRDCLAHAPTWVALNGGLNDCNRLYHDRVGVEPARYAAIMDALFTQTRDAVPGVRLLMMGPYTLTRDDQPGSYNREVRERLRDYQAAAAACCRRHEVAFVDSQAALDRLLERMPVRRFASDGCHTDELGSLALAEVWLDGLARASGRGAAAAPR